MSNETRRGGGITTITTASELGFETPRTEQPKLSPGLPSNVEEMRQVLKEVMSQQATPNNNVTQ